MAKILHIAVSDRKIGVTGAAVLHEELLMRREHSELWVFDRKSKAYGVYKIAENFAENEFITETHLNTILHGRNVEFFDVIHIHGLGKQISPAVLTELAKVKQLFWSLEDCAPYTAGCSHSAHCDQWKDSCASCPVYAGKTTMQDMKKTLFIAKKSVYKNIKLTFFCQNEWQKNQLKQSMAGNQQLEIYPSWVDATNFYPGNQKNSRSNLGLPENSFVAIFPTDLGEGSEQVISYVQSTLKMIRDQYNGYFVLVNFGKEKIKGDWAVDEIRNVDVEHASYLAGEYLRAANVQLYFSGTDSSYFSIREAGFCALPSIAFNIGAVKDLIEDEMGDCLQSFSEEQLAGCLLNYINKPELLIKKGAAFYTSLYGGKKSVEEYQVQYSADEILLKKVPDDFTEILQCDDQVIAGFLEKQIEKRTSFANNDDQGKRQNDIEKNIFIDKFFTAWLKVVIKNRKDKIWPLVNLWLSVRQVQIGQQFFNEAEVNAHLEFCQLLRNSLVQYFHSCSLKEFAESTKLQTTTIAKLWYFVFLNTEAILNRAANKFDCPKEYVKEEGKTGYPLVFIQSMFCPHITEPLNIQMKQMMTSELPVALRVVTAFWLMSAPFFDGTIVQQQAVFRYIREMCHFMIAMPEYLSPGLCYMVMDKIMVSLWRLSYLGGNNIETLRAYGDFLQSFAKHNYPQYVLPIKPRKHHKKEPLKIGYVSLNFRNQAVSQYMANRIKYHDKKKFFVKTFILGKDAGDAMTQHIRDWSDAFEDIQVMGFQDIEKVAAAIKKSDLDLLIYADIGMNNMTYILGAMRLAPVQSVLVGHGTTTGLTTIDYYVSGDHEPANAQEHYTEKIICLPHAGAAQLPPEQSAKVLTRKEFGIPDDAVLFLSCANGLKHVERRDDILIKILQQAPNAYILLKPYMSPNTIDWKFRDRLVNKAKQAGVDARLKVIPPLPESGDLMALIKLADVQLDTYPYGGWTTNLEALYYHLPIVTQQGDMARSRWGAGLLSAMGIEEGIAKNEEEYVAWAVQFAVNKNLRQMLSMKIQKNASCMLFDGSQSQHDYEKCIVEMLNEKRDVTK